MEQCLCSSICMNHCFCEETRLLPPSIPSKWRELRGLVLLLGEKLSFPAGGPRLASGLSTDARGPKSAEGSAEEVKRGVQETTMLLRGTMDRAVSELPAPTSKQRNLEKSKILCFGALSIAVFHGIRDFEVS